MQFAWPPICNRYILIFLLSAWAVTPNVFASVMQNEIDHLLGFVESTTCQYERNGQLHSGVQAVAHIRNKYNYFKDDIDSTEKFVELSATRSTMSGRYYHVLCAGSPEMTSQQWLLQELQRYRAARSGSALNR